MSNEAEKLDALESLRVIRETIDLAKRNVQENGFQFLLWGGLVVVTSMTDWYLQNILHDAGHYRAWFLMVIVGVPASLIYEWRRDRQKRPSTLLNQWYGLIWLGFGISIFIAIMAAVRGGISPIPLVLLFAAFATYLSGIVLQFKPLYWGAAALWIGAGVCLFLPANHHTLVNAVAIILGYVAPGLLLNRQYHRV